MHNQHPQTQYPTRKNKPHSGKKSNITKVNDRRLSTKLADVSNIDKKSILNGFNLEIKAGEVHAIMGPNGSGKSTLSNILSGKKGYNVSGEILYLTLIHI